MYQENADDFSRIELGFACTKEYENYFMPMITELSGVSNILWSNMTCLAHGHTITSNAIDGFAAVWLLNANLLEKGSSPIYELAFGKRVNLLWAIPLTQKEYDCLVKYDMKKMSSISFGKNMHIFDGTKKL